MPNRLGGYRLLGRLRAGGMAEVYLAQSPAGERVAIKRLLPHLDGDRALRRVAREEARIGQRLRHPTWSACLAPEKSAATRSSSSSSSTASALATFARAHGFAPGLASAADRRVLTGRAKRRRHRLRTSRRNRPRRRHARQLAGVARQPHRCSPHGRGSASSCVTSASRETAVRPSSGPSPATRLTSRRSRPPALRAISVVTSSRWRSVRGSSARVAACSRVAPCRPRSRRFVAPKFHLAASLAPWPRLREALLDGLCPDPDRRLPNARAPLVTRSSIGCWHMVTVTMR